MTQLQLYYMYEKIFIDDTKIMHCFRTVVSPENDFENPGDFFLIIEIV